MNKKIVGLLIASIIIISSIHIVPVIAGEANDNQQTRENTKNNLRPERELTLRNEQLISDLEQSIEGNSLEAFQKEMKNKLIREKAKELSLSTDGKSLEDLENELRAAFGNGLDTKKNESTPSKDINDLRLNAGNRKELLLNKAKEYGIETENQKAETIQQKILEEAIYEIANELGISTKGKELKTILDQLEERDEKQ